MKFLESMGALLLVFALGSVLGAILVFIFIADTYKSALERVKYDNIQKIHCVEGEQRFLVQMPDKTRQWVRGRTPIPCKTKNQKGKDNEG